MLCSNPLRLGGISPFSCSLTCASAFSFEPKTFSTLLASISGTLATTTHTFIIVDSTLHDTEVAIRVPLKIMCVKNKKHAQGIIIRSSGLSKEINYKLKERMEIKPRSTKGSCRNYLICMNICVYHNVDIANI